MSKEAISRATRAYTRKCAREGIVAMQPGAESGIERRGGDEFVVLRNVGGTLARYRISPATGRLVACAE